MDLVTLKFRISESEDKNLLTFDDLDNIREVQKIDQTAVNFLFSTFK